jgi:hypothetical protein
MMRTLEAAVAKLGGQLPPGWRCAVKTRVGPNGAARNDAFYTSPDGAHFRWRSRPEQLDYSASMTVH